jgi:hypothetical protein
VIALDSRAPLMHSIAVNGCRRQALVADRELGIVHFINTGTTSHHEFKFPELRKRFDQVRHHQHAW